MNGRVYDPTWGRFLQADPIIQSPYDLQSYNRYSYVMNNPLSFTDPTGFSRWTRIRDRVIKPIAAGVIAWYVGGLASNWFLEGVANSMLQAGSSVCVGDMGVLTSLAAGAPIGGTGLTYGAAASAIGGAAGGFAAGGIMGGNLQSALQGAVGGGLSGFAGSYTSGIGRTITQAAVGGAVSSAFGGSFRNGASPVIASFILGHALDIVTPDSLTLYSCANEDCVKAMKITKSGTGFLNGILNDKDAAIVSARGILGFGPDFLIQNPTQGFFMDAIETFQDTFGIGSKASRFVRGVLQQASSDGHSIDLYAHSQGGAIARSALAGTGGIPNLTVTFVGAPITRFSAYQAAGTSYGGFRMNSNDFVPVGLGWNGGPGSFFSAARAIPSLFSATNSPHSGYAYPPGR